LFFNCPFSQTCWRLLEIHWDFAGDFFPKWRDMQNNSSNTPYGDLHRCCLAHLGLV
jgi:hypothetical protein